jgi:hypothetical protein
MLYCCCFCLSLLTDGGMEEYQPELEGEPMDHGQDYEFGGDVEVS